MAPRKQRLGGGSSVVPGPSRRLQRERPFSVAPDPMWNSSREILPYGGLATRSRPPRPTYTEVVVPPSGRIETVEIEPSTLRSPSLDVREVYVIPRVPGVTEEVAQHNDPPYSLSPSTTRQAHNQNTTASEDHDHDLIDDNPNVKSRLGETARGKKRTREEDYSPDEKDESETLEYPLGEDCSSGSGGRNPNSAGTGTGTSSDRDGQPDRKRMKTRMGLVETLTDAESWRPVKKLKNIVKLYRGGRLLL